MKTIYEIKEVCRLCIESLEQDKLNPLNKGLNEYFNGKIQAYRTVMYYIDKFQENKIVTELDDYFMDLIEKPKKQKRTNLKKKVT